MVRQINVDRLANGTPATKWAQNDTEKEMKLENKSFSFRKLPGKSEDGECRRRSVQLIGRGQCGTTNYWPNSVAIEWLGARVDKAADKQCRVTEPTNVKVHHSK